MKCHASSVLNVSNGRSPHGERGLKYGRSHQRPNPHASLPARGAWIEMHQSKNARFCKSKSLPARGAWIEMLKAMHHNPPLWSLPARGAWIEIFTTRKYEIQAESLPARGAWIEILSVTIQLDIFFVSLPARGAWIEIPSLGRSRRAVSSLPARGAWIEILLFRFENMYLPSRSPHGERGLKYLTMNGKSSGSHVAPRTGSVD